MHTEHQRIEAATQEGRAAFRHGRQINENPYNHAADQSVWSAWRAGFIAAEQLGEVAAPTGGS
jgi:ribosome modulation factor